MYTKINQNSPCTLTEDHDCNSNGCNCVYDGEHTIEKCCQCLIVTIKDQDKELAD
jgi:hypothetical protein